MSNSSKKNDPLKNPDQANEIIPGLWLGDMYSAANLNFIKDKNIKAIINITPSLSNRFESLGIEYLKIPIDDSLKVSDINSMTAMLPLIVDHIHKMRDIKKKNLLIHCHAGMQRSAISVAAYLVSKYGMSPSKAISYIIARRPIAFYNGKSINFHDSLKIYHKNLRIVKRLRESRQPPSFKSKNEQKKSNKTKSTLTSRSTKNKKSVKKDKRVKKRLSR